MMVNVRNISFNTKSLCVFLTKCMELFHVMPPVRINSFPKLH
jgi:hypothetical protein